MDTSAKLEDNIDSVNVAAAKADSSPNRVVQSVAFLTSLSDPTLDEVIWDRACGRPDPPELPPSAWDESRVQIFIDVIQYEADGVAIRLRSSSTRLLSKAVEKEPIEEAFAVAELCFLTARAGAYDAIPALTVLVEREHQRQTPVSGRETLYSGALESLGGLLANLDTEHRHLLNRNRHRSLFVGALDTPGCVLPALTVLIGLKLGTEAEFRSMLPEWFARNEAALRASLTISFGSKSAAFAD